jgi:hypothetical protein
MVTSESFTLTKSNGAWLGQIVLTSDGMISGVTDWGNFALSFRSYGKDFNDFKKFICGLDYPYFGTKIYTAMNYIAANRKFEQACDRIAEKILPELQKVLKESLKEETKELFV